MVKGKSKSGAESTPPPILGPRRVFTAVYAYGRSKDGTPYNVAEPIHVAEISTTGYDSYGQIRWWSDGSTLCHTRAEQNRGYLIAASGVESANKTTCNNCKVTMAQMRRIRMEEAEARRRAGSRAESEVA